MAMKKLEKAMFEKMVLNDGYTHRKSIMIYEGPNEVKPYVESEFLSEVNSVPSSTTTLRPVSKNLEIKKVRR